MRLRRWLRALALCSVTLVSACSDDPPATPRACTPECREGFTCVQGACVTACNPPCGAGETCAMRGGATVCVPGGGDGGTPPADVTGMDAPTQGDSAAPQDTAAPWDAPPTPDGSVTRPGCGTVGMPCCSAAGSSRFFGSCAGNAVCNLTSMRCEAFTPDPGECTTTGECPSGQTCTLTGEPCGGGSRVCLRCVPRATTGLPAGTRCDGTMACADGICANSRCTRACVPGASGDEACRRFDPQSTCVELGGSLRLDAGLGPSVTYGACIRACQRDADCPASFACGLALSLLHDRLVQICQNPFGMLEGGASCPLRPTSSTDRGMYCRAGSNQCYQSPSNMTAGYCASFCATDADCPAGGFACVTQNYLRPSESMTATQQIRVCVRR